MKDKLIRLKERYKERIKLKNYLFFPLLVLVIFLVFQIIDIGKIRGFIDQSGIFAPIVFGLVKIFFVVLAPMPSFPVLIFAGPLFGFFKGLVYLVIADVIGSSIAFFLSRVYGTRFMHHVIPKKRRDSIIKGLSSLDTWQGLVLTRIVVPFQELITYTAGLSKISYRDFIISSTIVKSIAFALLIAVSMALLDRRVFIIVASISFILALCVIIYKIVTSLKKHYRQKGKV